MQRSVIVFSFPEEDEAMMQTILDKAKAFFAVFPDVEVHMAIKGSAQMVLSVFDKGD